MTTRDTCSSRTKKTARISLFFFFSPFFWTVRISLRIRIQIQFERYAVIKEKYTGISSNWQFQTHNSFSWYRNLFSIWLVYHRVGHTSLSEILESFIFCLLVAYPTLSEFDGKELAFQDDEKLLVQNCLGWGFDTKSRVDIRLEAAHKTVQSFMESCSIAETILIRAWMTMMTEVDSHTDRTLNQCHIFVDGLNRKIKVAEQKLE